MIQPTLFDVPSAAAVPTDGHAIAGQANTVLSVLDLIAAHRYGVLAQHGTVWIDGQGNWCFTGLRDDHRAILSNLQEHGHIEVSRQTRRVRLSDQPVQVRLYQRTTTGIDLHGRLVALLHPEGRDQ